VHNFLPAYTWRKVANLSLALDTDDCVRRTPTRAYCSESTHVLEDRSFAVAGPRVWNSIAARVRHHTRISTSTQNASIWSQTAAAPSDSVFCAVYKLAYLLTYLLTYSSKLSVRASNNNGLQTAAPSVCVKRLTSYMGGTLAA